MPVDQGYNIRTGESDVIEAAERLVRSIASWAEVRLACSVHSFGSRSMRSSRFVIGCAIIAAAVLAAGRLTALPVWLLAAEVLLTILGLFLFGSFQYQIHKNALTYGMLLDHHRDLYGLAHLGMARRNRCRGAGCVWVSEHLLSFGGLDELIHADTMLFILGLTFFVSVIAQTRLLEGIAFFLLRRNRGLILPTVISVTLVVAFASGILDGVSMVGLTIRTLVIIMMLAAAPPAAVRYAVMVCTAVTTICGVWLAYGEPPNLIMKANLYPHLGNAFFLAVLRPGSGGGVSRRRGAAAREAARAPGQPVEHGRHRRQRRGCPLSPGDAARAGVVVTRADRSARRVGDEWAEPVMDRIRAGEPLGTALVREGVPEDTRTLLLGFFVAEELADSLDRHYVYDVAGEYELALQAELAVDEVLAAMAKRRRSAQKIGALALLPFMAMLVVHGVYHQFPLFIAAFVGFLAALPAIGRIPRMRGLAPRRGPDDSAVSIFSVSAVPVDYAADHGGVLRPHGVTDLRRYEPLGHAPVALVQFLARRCFPPFSTTTSSPTLPRADCTMLDLNIVHLFAMAQIVGYALGGCWTHVGCAQSVVAYTFIQRDVDEHYTPMPVWMKEMTPVILKILLVMAAIIYAESAILGLL